MMAAEYRDALKRRKRPTPANPALHPSTMVFLHRAAKGNENPTTAWESGSRVWSPDGPRKRFTSDLLARHGIQFDPF